MEIGAGEMVAGTPNDTAVPQEQAQQVQGTRVPYCFKCNTALLRNALYPNKFLHPQPTGCPVDGMKIVDAEEEEGRPFRVAWREPPAPPPDPMKDAIRTKLHALIDAPDFGSKTLATLIKVARSAREMLQAEQPGSRWRQQRRMPGGIYPGVYGGMGMDPDGLDDESPEGAIGPSGMSMYGGALAPSSFQETFGANVIREAISALPMLLQKPEKMSDLIDAMAVAKANELPEVVEQLAAKIKERLANMSPKPETPESMAMSAAQAASVEPAYYAMATSPFPGGA